MTEVWFRNPQNYIRELVDCQVGRVAWDRGMLAKRNIDPYKHASLYFGRSLDWRVLLVGNQGTAELQFGRDVDQPVAVYPTWEASESLELLEEMMAYPVGDDEEMCNDTSVPADERPVSGQQHRVVVSELPTVTSGPGRALVRKLVELQEDYPDCILHLHGVYSWRVQFGMGLKSVDNDPRTSASKGKVFLPSGKEMIAEKTIGCPQWVTMLGMNVVDLKVPRNRCIYNIKSALWAGENYMENIKFKSTGDAPVDYSSAKHVPATTQSHMSSKAVAKPGDKQLCNTCSLQNSCKYYRNGAVCSVPGSEPAPLANYFQTRDADMIIDGLGTLLAAQTRRMDRGIRDEEDYGELDPEVTKLMNQIFTNGVKLAKLVNPKLNGGARVQVNVGQSGEVSATNPNQLMGAMVRELEARGIPRNEITPQMIQGLLTEMSGGTSGEKAIEGQVLGRHDEAV